MTDRRRDSALPLSELRCGLSAFVVEIGELYRDRLAGFGLYPGVEVSLHQTYPSFVIRVDELELALETEIAREVLVVPHGSQT
ncbi:MAG: hypothetical protein Kow00109_02060 [Acidobacteriota bacterium]